MSSVVKCECVTVNKTEHGVEIIRMNYNCNGGMNGQLGRTVGTNKTIPGLYETFCSRKFRNVLYLRDISAQ